MKEFLLEVVDDNATLGLLEGDELLVSTEEQPRGNGKDLAILEIAGAYYVSPFTRMGNQILLLGEKIQVFKANNVKIIGKVIGGSVEIEKKKPLRQQRLQQLSQQTESQTVYFANICTVYSTTNGARHVFHCPLFLLILMILAPNYIYKKRNC